MSGNSLQVEFIYVITKIMVVNHIAILMPNFYNFLKISF